MIWMDRITNELVEIEDFRWLDYVLLFEVYGSYMIRTKYLKKNYVFIGWL
jgi:hypothetical protein